MDLVESRVIADYDAEFPEEEVASQFASLRSKLAKSSFLKRHGCHSSWLNFASRMSNSLKVRVLILADKMKHRMVEAMVEAVAKCIRSFGVTTLIGDVFYGNVGDFPLIPEYNPQITLSDLDDLLKHLPKHLAYAVMRIAWTGKRGNHTMNYEFLRWCNLDCVGRFLAKQVVVKRADFLQNIKLFRLPPQAWERILETSVCVGSKDVAQWVLRNRAGPSAKFFEIVRKRFSANLKRELTVVAKSVQIPSNEVLSNEILSNAIDYGLWQAVESNCVEDLAFAQTHFPEDHARFMVRLARDRSVVNFIQPMSFAPAAEYCALVLKHRSPGLFVDELISLVTSAEMAWRGEYAPRMALQPSYQVTTRFVRLIRLAQGHDLDDEIDYATFEWIKDYKTANLSQRKYVCPRSIFFACLDRPDLMGKFLASQEHKIEIHPNELVVFAMITFEGFLLCAGRVSLDWALLVERHSLSLRPQVLDIILRGIGYKDFTPKHIKGSKLKLLDLALALKMPTDVTMKFWDYCCEIFPKCITAETRDAVLELAQQAGLCSSAIQAFCVTKSANKSVTKATDKPSRKRAASTKAATSAKRRCTKS